MLDPRISYEGLLTDCGNDVSLRNYLELSRERLQTLYRTKYARDPLPNSASTPPAPANASRGSPQKVDFTARYKRRVQAYVDELEEYFKLPQENFDVCDPVQWWAGRRAQFPNLSRLARDILSIPGEIKIFLAEASTHCLSLVFVAARLCCGCRADLLRGKGHDITASCESETGHHSHIDACEAATPSGTHCHSRPSGRLSVLDYIILSVFYMSVFTVLVRKTAVNSPVPYR